MCKLSCVFKNFYGKKQFDVVESTLVNAFQWNTSLRHMVAGFFESAWYFWRMFLSFSNFQSRKTPFTLCCYHWHVQIIFNIFTVTEFIVTIIKTTETKWTKQNTHTNIAVNRRASGSSRVRRLQSVAGHSNSALPARFFRVLFLHTSQPLRLTPVHSVIKLCDVGQHDKMLSRRVMFCLPKNPYIM